MPSTLTTAADSPSALQNEVLTAALHGLNVPAGIQKTLPPWLFYDDVGSALFDRITEVPEYYLTRAERSIFEERADDIVAREAGHTITVAELGAGSAAKTGLLLAAAARRQPTLLYQPIDVSAAALDQAATSLTAAVPGLEVRPQVVNYISSGYTIERPEGTHILALYIGSSIGNFSPLEARDILRRLRGHLSNVGDALLLGADLAPCTNKALDVILAAYDDPAGVTAEFNKNILARLNRDLGANFDLSCFQHRAYWNASECRIEMHLESLAAQTVVVSDHEIRFAAGESIHTENSYKFTERSLRELLHDTGFGSPQWFYDSDRLFAAALAFPS